MSTNPPPGQTNVSPYLVAENASGLLEFVKTVFGGEEGCVMRGPNEIIMHGEVRIGESVIMLADSCEHAKPATANLHVYVPDIDDAYQRALNAGAESEREPADQFYGDRSASVKDAFGNTWHIATHVEDVSPEEMERRQREMSKQEQQKK